jgi:hypothetical protein
MRFQKSSSSQMLRSTPSIDNVVTSPDWTRAMRSAISARRSATVSSRLEEAVDRFSERDELLEGELSGLGREQLDSIAEFRCHE